jgi:hypothetical protein
MRRGKMTIYDVFNRWALLKAENGGRAPDYSAAALKQSYDGYVEEWKAYYRGEVEGINSDRGWNGVAEYPVIRKSMKLPKLIARKWATTLLSEAFKITLSTEEETEKFDALARRIGLRPKLTEAVASGFALGTSAIVAGAGLRRDVKEGDQVTFIGRDLLLIKTEGDGGRKRWFDNREGRFFTIDQDVGAGGEKRIFEKYAPEIRCEQFLRARREAADWAAMASGLGKGMLDEKANPTATGVIYSESDKMREKSLHEQYLEGDIVKLARAICELSALMGNPIGAEEVNVVWEDSVISDTAEEKRLAMLEVDAGLVSKAEYRRRFYGEEPEEAAAKIAEIAAAEPDEPMTRR